MSERKDAMARLLQLVGAETAPLGLETREWLAYRRKVTSALRALLRERADDAHAATWNALASRVETKLLEYASGVASAAVLGARRRRT